MWPSMMNRTIASKYLGISPVTFDKHYRRLIKPVPFVDNSDRWLKKDIDVLLNQIQQGEIILNKEHQN